MSKEEFVNQLLTLLDSAPYNWTLYEVTYGAVSVDDLMDLISIYNEIYYEESEE